MPCVGATLQLDEAQIPEQFVQELIHPKAYTLDNSKQRCRKSLLLIGTIL